MAFADELRNADRRSVEEIIFDREMAGTFKELKEYCMLCASRKKQNYAAGYIVDRGYDPDFHEPEYKYTVIEQFPWETWPDKWELPESQKRFYQTQKDRDKEEAAHRSKALTQDKINKEIANFTKRADRLVPMLQKEGIRVREFTVVPVYLVYQAVREEGGLFSKKLYKVKMNTNFVVGIAIKFHLDW